MEQKRLCLSKDKVIGGVCGGLAEYFGIDPTIVRLAWILFTFIAPTGLLLYLAAMVIIPAGSDADGVAETAGTGTQSSWERPDSRNRALGIVLLVFGAILLINKIIPGISWQIVLSVVLIGLGLFLLIKSN